MEILKLENIEKAFGEKVSCRIAVRLEGVNVFDKDDWNKMAEYLVDVSQRMGRI